MSALAACALTTYAGQPPAVDPDDITGRDFAGVRLPLAPVRGPITLAATRANVWTEQGDSGPVQRIVLDGRTSIRIGTYAFDADRAALWIERLPDASGAPGRVHQVFALLDNAGNSAADAAVTVSARRLPVRAVIDLEGGITLRADSRREGPPSIAFVGESEAVFADTLRALVAPPEPGIPSSPTDISDAAAAADDTPDEVRRAIGRLAPAGTAEPIFAREGIISVAPGHITIVSGERENAAIASEGVVVQYQDLRRGRTLQLTAQRAVVFLPPGPLADLGRLASDGIRGIYLEGDVQVTDGSYTLRGPRVYYDLQRDRGIVLDAVFWTYDRERQLPLYVRADAIRQQAADQFKADAATLTNTAFLDPLFSLGASSITVTRRPRTAADGPGSTTRNYVDADDLSLRLGPLPFFYLPKFRGDPEQIPIRDIRVENSSGSGAALKTRWDAFSLVGQPRPENITDADVYLDGYFERGVATGGRLGWGDLDGKGEVFGYMIIDDHGTDVLSPGTERDWDGSTRGVLTGQHRERLSEEWTLLAEVSHIGDETFLDGFFEDAARDRREFTNRANLRHLGEKGVLTFETQAAFSDFIANEYLLQSQGFSVQRLPEITYTRVGDDILGPEDPGLLTYFSEYRAGMLAMNFDDPNADQRGFDTVSLAQRAFGINPNESIADRLRREGYIESDVARFDTRHELVSQLNFGPVNVVPFAVLRGAAYNQSFDAYSPDEDASMRAWGSIGSRFSTTVQHVDDGVESRMFDLHRMRHIIEPGVTLMTAGSSLDGSNLPVYDEWVEGIAEGSMIRAGVHQTWQTQRGGPGRWHTVDVFRVNIDAVFWSDDADRTSPIGRYVDGRPEQGNPGEFIVSDGSWQVSDGLMLVGSVVFDTDGSEVSRSSTGALVEHAPGFTSYVEYRQLQAQDSEYLDFGARYELSRLYTLGVDCSYDLVDAGFQRIGADVRRRFAGAVIGFGISHNEIDGQTSFGLTFQPIGASGEFGASTFGASGGGSGRSRLGG